MTPGSVRLPARSLRAIEALAEGASFKVAAKRAGVNVRTLHRWRAEPVFAAALQAARDATFAEALERLRHTTSAAVATCVALMKPSVPPELRLSAARVVLASALRANEQVGIEARLAAIERTMAERGEL